MATTLGEKIKKLRKEKGLTLEALAIQSGSSKSYIWELENKNPPRPSGEKVSAIARELGVTADYLLDESQDQPSDQVAEEVFLRTYRGLDSTTQERIRQLTEMWAKEPKGK